MAEIAFLILGFILASGLLAMTDAALLSISYAEVEEMVAKGKWGSLPLRAVHRRITRAVVVIVIITNTINVLGPILVGQRAIELFGSDVIGYITGILTFATIIFSEIIPKAIGAHNAPHISRVVAPVILVLIYALYPVVILLEKFVGLFKIGKRRAIGTEEQIRALARSGSGAGHIHQAEGELIHRVFVLNDRQAQDLMTPRKKVVALRVTTTIREAVSEVANSQHSRYPVFEGSLDNVKGIAMNSDLYEALALEKDDQHIRSLMRDILFVPANMRADALLSLFRKRHIHLAVVQDGQRTVGIVSLEDVLEELVGEIEDERDAGKILT